MNSDDHVVIIEDDADDRSILESIFNDIIERNSYKNKVVFLNDGYQALDYLRSIMDQPFIIVSDINMPKMNGFELRDVIFNDERLKNLCIPYVFLTTSDGNREDINKAFHMSVQGFFKKHDNIEEYSEMLEGMLKYWKRSLKPHFN